MAVGAALPPLTRPLLTRPLPAPVAPLWPLPLLALMSLVAAREPLALVVKVVLVTLLVGKFLAP